jgi:suppressor for copper-sensitivity B
MRILAAFLVAAASVFSTPAAARDPVTVELVNAGYADGSGRGLLGIDISLDEGWHTYWKSAGEGGFPPVVDTARSTNLGSFELVWPAPDRIETSGGDGGNPLQTNGFKDRLIIPVLARPIDPEVPVNIDVGLRVFACKDICSAFDVRLDTTLEPGFRSPSALKELATWLRKVPRTDSATLRLGDPVGSGGGRFEVDLTSSRVLLEPWVHVADVANTPYRVEIVDAEPADNPTRVRFAVTPEGGPFASEGGLELVATDGETTVSSRVSTPNGQPVPGFAILGTAFLGGLILNLMPCVFPVLTLKLMSLTGSDVRSVRRGFAATSFGIVLSFMTLASVLLALRVVGVEIGWGIQFQSAAFLTFMIAVLLLFAANTAGLFEITLPGRLMTSLARGTSGRSTAASIGQGFVATLLATPCSAPFVGTAVAFALAGSTIDILSVFFFMGIGMALPFVVAAATPGSARVIPRPGGWMNSVKAMISLGLFATAGWLATTLLVVAPILAAVSIFAVAAGCLWLAVRSATGRGLAFAALAAASFSLPLVVDRYAGVRPSTVAWSAFEPARIDTIVGKGGTVLVNLTAKWCLTCKLNDRTTWSAADVTAALAGKTAMQGDWTNPDPAILSFLRDHGRFGIPFTIVFSPAYPQGRVLPELLSPAAVIEVMK